MKKVVCLLLAFMLAIPMFVVPVSAAEAEKVISLDEQPITPITMINPGDDLSSQAPLNAVGVNDIQDLEDDEIVRLVLPNYSLYTGAGVSYHFSAVYKQQGLKEITSGYKLISKNKDVVVVEDDIMLVALSSGVAEMELYYAGLTETFYVAVDYYPESINVGGYDINFDKYTHEYEIMLKEGEKNPPKITYSAPDNVEINIVEHLLGMWYLVEINNPYNGEILYSYIIKIAKYIDPSETQYPYVIQYREAKVEDRYVLATMAFKNPYYKGEIPKSYLGVQQRLYGDNIIQHIYPGLVTISTGRFMPDMLIMVVDKWDADPEIMSTPLAKSVLFKSKLNNTEGDKN